MTIKEKLNLIQTSLKAPKSQRNDFAHFNYRNCEDILEAVKPLLKETKTTLVLSDEIVNIGNRYYVKSIAILSDCESEGLESVDAYAREAEVKKGMDESQITGATSSYARKYALNGLFAIDDTKDSDSKDNTKDKEKDEVKITPATVEQIEKIKEGVIQLKLEPEGEQAMLIYGGAKTYEKLSQKGAEKILKTIAIKLSKHEVK